MIEPLGATGGSGGETVFRISTSVSQADSPAQGAIYDPADPFTYEDLGLTPPKPERCPLWTEDECK